MRSLGALLTVASLIPGATAQQRASPVFNESMFRLETARASVNRQHVYKTLTVSAKIVNKIDVPIRVAIYDGNRFGIQVEEGSCNFNATEGITRTSYPPSRLAQREAQDFIRISPKGSAGFSIKYLCQDLNSTYVTLTVPIVVGEEPLSDRQIGFTVFSALLDDIPLPATASR